jgi:hypothetical protein
MNRFYVWHLIHGICISNEYTLSEEHPLAKARRNVALMLTKPDFQQAAHRMDTTDFSWKQKIHLQAMKCRLELLFYWLYVIKPRKNVR